MCVYTYIVRIHLVLFEERRYLVDTHTHIHTYTMNTSTLYFSRRGATSLASEMVVPEITMRYQ